jgi:hypothetical protein
MGIRSISYLQKPTLFIASSKEAKDIALAVKKHFQPFCNTDIWTDNVFAKNKTFLESLLNFSSFYDFSIVLLTADDKRIVRKKRYAVPRDNLLFELGLFMGRLGTHRAFALAEDKIKILSDFHGVSLASFSRTKSPKAESLRMACEQIREEMAKAESRYRLSILPSTSLAIGYYHNFLRHVIATFQEANNVQLYRENKQRQKVDVRNLALTNRKLSLTILLPKNFKQLDKYSSILKKRGFSRIFFSREPRPFPFYIQGRVARTGNLHFYDIPTTLLSSKATIRELFDDEYLKKKNHQEIIEQREISNFEKTIRKLLADATEDVKVKFEVLV